MCMCTLYKCPRLAPFACISLDNIDVLPIVMHRDMRTSCVHKIQIHIRQ